MSSLIDKLSTLVNAQVNDLLGRNPRSPLARMGMNPQDAARNPRQSASQMRQRLEEAIAYEDTIRAKVDRLTQEALDLDEQVDAATQAGDSFEMRRLQTQLNLKQQQVAIAESELRDHQLVTRHLMQELHGLEMALDGQERSGTSIPIDAAEAGASAQIETAIRGAADKITGSIGALQNRQPQPPRQRPTRFQIVEETPDPRTPKPQGKDASDMNNRLSRLSKPDD